MPQTTQHQPDGQSEIQRRRAILLIIGSLNTVVAFVVGSVQQKSLGDDPATMIACGCLLACIAGALPLGPPALLGLVSMAGFPAWALVDLAMHGGHSLLPIEFAFYAVYGGLGVGVASIAALCRARSS